MSWTGLNSTVFCTSESDAWIVRFTGPVGSRSSPPVIDWYLSVQHGNNVYLVDVLDLCWLQSHLRVKIGRTCPSSQRAHPSPVPRTATAALQQSSRSLGRLACVFPQRLVGSPRSSSWLAPWVPVPIQQRVVHSGGMNCVCSTRRESSDCPAPVSASIDNRRCRFPHLECSPHCRLPEPGSEPALEAPLLFSVGLELPELVCMVAVTSASLSVNCACGVSVLNPTQRCVARVSVLQLWNFRSLLKAFESKRVGLSVERRISLTSSMNFNCPQALGTVSTIGGCRCTTTAASTSRPCLSAVPVT